MSKSKRPAINWPKVWDKFYQWEHRIEKKDLAKPYWDEQVKKIQRLVEENVNAEG